MTKRKRIADKELTDRNWDQEDEGEEGESGGTFKSIKGFSLTGSAAGGGGAFPSFGNGAGFKSVSTIANGSSRVSITPSTPGFASAASTTTPATSLMFNGLASSPSPTADVTSKQPNGSAPSLAQSAAPGPAQSLSSSSSSRSREYSCQLTSLNCSVRDWIDKHVNETPVCDLSPIFRDYERHLASIEQKYGTGAGPESQEKGGNTESSQPAASGGGSSASQTLSSGAMAAALFPPSGEESGRMISVKLKYTHSLNEHHPGVYNICNGQVAIYTVNVQDVLAIESEQSKQFSTSLSSDFHTTIRKKGESGGSFKTFKGFSLTGSAAGGGGAFPSFGNGAGFKSVSTMANGSSRASVTPSFPGFASATSTTTPAASLTFNGPASSPPPTADVTSKQPIGSAPSQAQSSAPGPAQSSGSSSSGADDGGGSSSRSRDYSRQLTTLNRSVRDWIDKHVNDTPVCDLSPIFRDYERHLDSIEQKYGTGAGPESQEKGGNTESSQPAASGGGSSSSACQTLSSGAMAPALFPPSGEEHPGVYNICNGQVAPDTVNVQDALAIGSEQSERFSTSLSSDFHKTIRKKALKKTVTVKVKAIYDVETLFNRLLVLLQQRSVDLADIFQFELSPVPTALIDEYGCLRKGNKAVLVKRLGDSVTNPPAPDVVLVDAGQLLHRVLWPVDGTAGDLAASFGDRLARYPPGSKKIVLFDKYNQKAPSAKDHERARRGSAPEVRLTPNTPLPCREAILHNVTNKSLLNNILCGFSLPHNIQLVNERDCAVTHAEADITLCSYMLKAAAEGAQTIRILSNDTDVFVLLVYWTSRMGVVANIHMEKWNGDVLDINKTVERLGPRKCSQFLGLHAMSGCDTVSYPFGKGKMSALKLLEMDIPGLDQVLGQPGVTHAQLKATADSFFFPLYGQESCTTMNDARSHVYRSCKNPPPLKRLLPTDLNLQLHVLRAHLQMLLWKAADKRDPPEEAQDITNFGWRIEGSAVKPAISTAPVAPQALLDLVSCSCSAEGKECSGACCWCNSASLPCTNYCKCEGGVACCSPFTSKQMDIDNNEEELGVDDDE